MYAIRGGLEMDEIKESTVKVVLDGNVITLAQLEEAKKNPSVRIIEGEKPGEYRTLKRMTERF